MDTIIDLPDGNIYHIRDDDYDVFEILNCEIDRCFSLSDGKYVYYLNNPSHKLWDVMIKSPFILKTSAGETFVKVREIDCDNGKIVFSIYFGLYNKENH